MKATNWCVAPLDAACFGKILSAIVSIVVSVAVVVVVVVVCYRASWWVF
jgi:multisubunit Na+/H+ antiporter MnhC subunit